MFKLRILVYLQVIVAVVALASGLSALTHAPEEHYPIQQIQAGDSWRAKSLASGQSIVLDFEVPSAGLLTVESIPEAASIGFFGTHEGSIRC